MLALKPAASTYNDENQQSQSPQPRVDLGAFSQPGVRPANSAICKLYSIFEFPEGLVNLQIPQVSDSEGWLCSCENRQV